MLSKRDVTDCYTKALNRGIHRLVECRELLVVMELILSLAKAVAKLQARVEINCNWKTTATERRFSGKARTNLTKVRHETADDVELLWPPLPKYRIIQDNKVMRNHLHLILKHNLPCIVV